MDLVDGYPLQNVNDVEDPAGTKLNIKDLVIFTKIDKRYLEVVLYS